MSTEPITGQTRQYRQLVRSVEAVHADRLRKSRDETDDEIRARYDISEGYEDYVVARERARERSVRVRWEQQAMLDALTAVAHEWLQTGQMSLVLPDYTEDATWSAPSHDLDGVLFTVTVRDLVATASVMVPAVTSRTAAARAS